MVWTALVNSVRATADGPGPGGFVGLGRDFRGPAMVGHRFTEAALPLDRLSVQIRHLKLNRFRHLTAGETAR